MTAASVKIRTETKERAPYEVAGAAADPFFSPKNLEALRQSIRQAEEGELYTFGSVEELDQFAREKLREKTVDASSIQ